MAVIAVGGMQHETNTFAPSKAYYQAFKEGGGWPSVQSGEPLFDAVAGANIPVQGAITALRNGGHSLVPLACAVGARDGRCLRADRRRFGAAAARGRPGRRRVSRPARRVGLRTLDLHANVTARMARFATALVGYHTAPHIDLYETGQRAAELLVSTLRGKIKPVMALARLPLIVPAENARHTDGPLSGIINRALELEHSGAILHGGVFSVQPWMDGSDVGCSVVIVTDGQPEAAQTYAQELAGTFWQRRADFIPELVSAEEAVRRALAGEERTVILCDSADAPSSGSTGDSSTILQALLGADTGRHLVLANVVDAAAAEAACAAGIGQQIRVNIGGSLAPQYFKPVEFTGYVKSLHDGEFRFKGQGMRGVTHHMGRTAVLVYNNIHLVVMSYGVTQWDPELYRSLGLEPGDARMVQVKSPAAFRAAYKDIADEIIIVDAPGAASPKLTALPWKRLGRPIYPLDDIQWTPVVCK